MLKISTTMLTKLPIVIGPSILSADFGNLYEECKNILEMGANSLHIDIMDGHFVPNLTIGPPVIQSLRKKLPQANFDCHLMVTHPDHYIQPLAKAKIDCFTFHVESEYLDLKKLCEKIKNSGIKVGISIKPNTQVTNAIEELIIQKLIDKVLVMTVEPGFGGQKFMENMMPKVKYLRSKYPNLDIQVDGGILLENIETVFQNGANCIVSGTGIFGVADKISTIKQMKELGSKYF